jgi:hypothetical protein
MRLIRIRRHTWDVLAVCDDRGDCQVLDFLESLEANYDAAVDAMLALLRERVPVHGPPRRMPLTRDLGQDLFEFRREPKGKRLRVIWFFDTGRVVVCTTAFTKDDVAPPQEIARGVRLRGKYFSDQKKGRNVIIELTP